MKKSLRDILVKLAVEVTAEVKVGTVKSGVVADIKLNDELHDLAHAEFEKDIAPFKAKMDEACKHFEERKAELWEGIMDELDVPQGERDKPYSLDMETGEVKMPAFAVKPEPETETVQ